MKVGDLIRHDDRTYGTTGIGVLLYDNKEGGTLKIYDAKKEKSYWIVRSQCRVLSPGSSVG